MIMLLKQWCKDRSTKGPGGLVLLDSDRRSTTSSYIASLYSYVAAISKAVRGGRCTRHISTW